MGSHVGTRQSGFHTPRLWFSSQRIWWVGPSSYSPLHHWKLLWVSRVPTVVNKVGWGRRMPYGECTFLCSCCAWGLLTLVASSTYSSKIVCLKRGSWFLRPKRRMYDLLVRHHTYKVHALCVPSLLENPITKVHNGNTNTPRETHQGTLPSAIPWYLYSIWSILRAGT